MELTNLTIESTRAAIAQRQFTASSLVEDFYRKIKAEDPEIHAYLTLAEDRALRQAKTIDDLVGQALDGALQFGRRKHDELFPQRGRFRRGHERSSSSPRRDGPTAKAYPFGRERARTAGRARDRARA